MALDADPGGFVQLHPRWVQLHQNLIRGMLLQETSLPWE